MGFPSEMLRLPDPPFLSSKPGIPSRGSLAIVGVPYDKGSTFRKGSALAPSRIRAVSDSIESYSPDLDMDISDLNLVDLGDIDVACLDPEGMVKSVEEIAKEIFAAGATPVAIGGEHTITLGLVRAAKSFYPDLLVLHMDAHADMRDRYEGTTINHATVMRRIIEELGDKRTIHAGIRSGTKEEFQIIGSRSRHDGSGRPLSFRNFSPRRILELMDDKPIYITLDIDVLDPSEAPGTGNPEPGGIRFSDLMLLLYGISGKKIVGADIVEVSPPHDVGDITSICAAKILREIMLVIQSGSGAPMMAF